MKFSELSHEWLFENHQFTVKDRTFLRYECFIRCHLDDVMGDIDINLLDARNLQHYLNIIRTRPSKRTNKPISSSSFNTLLIILKLIFDYAYNFNILPNNPTLKLKRVKQEPRVSNAFTKIEQAKIQNYIDNLNNDEYFPITLCFYTGLRIGEALALTYKDIDLRSGILKITKSLYRTKENGEWIIKTSTPKTTSSTREIPLPTFLVEDIRERKKRRISNNLCTRNDGSIMDDKFLRNRFKQVLKHLRIRKLNFHCIRHTFATRALENKMDIKTLSEILGHSNASITLNIYAHSMIEHKKSQMRKIKKIV